MMPDCSCSEFRLRNRPQADPMMRIDREFRCTLWTATPRRNRVPMNEIHEKVTRCFANVFPSLPSGEIPHASTTSLAAWDSLAHVTLLAAIAEEFGQDFSLDDYQALVSYSLIVDYLETRVGNGRGAAASVDSSGQL